MKELVMQAQAMQQELVAWRREIHQNPELGMELPKTAAFVEEKLREMGYEPKRCAGDGVVALAGGKKPGKCFLIRGDMDALPMMEEAEEPFKATNGAMHSCGHDFHTTMLLGAAKLLKAHEDMIQGSVKLMFQPGEETLQGAKQMIADGVLQDPKVDAAAMFHMATGVPFPSGIILVPSAGILSAASDRFEITVQGKGGHGAMPQQAVDPLNVMSHIYINLQTIISRELAPSDEAVVTVGVMEGGTANNIIPDTAVMKGTIRTFDPKVRELIFERVKGIAENTAAAFRATADVQIIEGCPSVIDDASVSEPLRAGLKAVFGDQAVQDPVALGQKRISGSEDFAFVTQEVPSVMMMLTGGQIQEGYQWPQHNPKARFDEKVLWEGAAAYAVAALSWLQANAEA